VPADGPIDAHPSVALDDSIRQLLEVVRAADEGDDSAEYRSGLEPGPDRHLLERPLHVLITFPERPQLGALRVDVLDYGTGFLDLSLALPPDLEVREGERGELRLIDLPAGATGPVPFAIQHLEPGSLVKVAQVRIDGKLGG
jgi:hypothetical protein